MKAIFRSRISLVLAVLLWGILLWQTFPFLINLFENFSTVPTKSIIIFFVIFCILFIIFFGMRYIIIGDELICKIWFINFRKIKISNIISITRSYNPIASNAASFKRIYCELKNSTYGGLLISPKKEKLFLKIIKEKNPTVKINVTNKKGFLRFWDWDL